MANELISVVCIFNSLALTFNFHTLSWELFGEINANVR